MGNDPQNKERVMKNPEIPEMVIQLDGMTGKPIGGVWQRMQVFLARIRVRSGKKWAGWISKTGKIILILVVIAVVAGATFWVGQEFATIQYQAESAVKIAKSVQSDVGLIKVKTEGQEKQLTLLSARLDGLDEAAAKLAGRADANDGVVAKIGTAVSDLTTKVGEAIAGLLTRVDSSDKAVKDVAKDVSAASVMSAKAIKIAEQAKGCQADRAKAESQQYKRMLAYIRGANPGSDLAKLSAKEVDSQLSDSVWNIEPQIAAEYQRLKDSAVLQVQQAADAAQESGRNAQSTADKALDAGETAVGGLKQIVDQPNRPFGKSVKTATKKAVKSDLAEYWERHGVASKTAAGAPK